MGMCQSFENLFDHVIRLNSEKGKHYRSLLLQYLNKNDTKLLLSAYGCLMTENQYQNLCKYSVEIGSWSLFKFAKPKANFPSYKDIYILLGASSLKFCEEYLDRCPIIYPGDLSNKKRKSFKLERLKLIWNAAADAHNSEIVEKYIDELIKAGKLCGVTKNNLSLHLFLIKIYASRSKKLFDRYFPQTIKLIKIGIFTGSMLYDIAEHGKEWMIDKFDKSVQTSLLERWVINTNVTRNILQRAFDSDPRILHFNNLFLKKLLENLNFEAFDWFVEQKFCSQTNFASDFLTINKKFTFHIIQKLLKYGISIRNIIQHLIISQQYILLIKFVTFYSDKYTKEYLISVIKDNSYFLPKKEELVLNKAFGV
jgi:hypothetical protein